MLARVLERTARAKLLDQVVVATTTAPADEAIVTHCQTLNIPVFRGSEEDVLDRYRGAALEHDADPIVRITSDCPLVDPDIVDEVLALYSTDRPDYASNVASRTFPQGLDVEVIRRGALELAWREARESHERVHVTPFIYQNRDRFRLATLNADQDYSRLRWTVDTAQDLEFVRAVYARLGSEGRFGWRNVLELLRREPALEDINRGIRQKSLEEG